MRYRELIEARRNPEQNPKVSVNQAIAARYEKADNIVGGTVNLFVSFTDIDKLGINPKSKYDTPLGIYAYPAEYVLDEIGEQYKADVLPFAGDSKYVNLFNVSGNIIELNRMSADSVGEYYNLIQQYVFGMAGLSKEHFTRLFGVIKNDAEGYSRFPTYPGGQLWYVTMKVAEFLSETLGGKAPVRWNQIFRGIGIDGAVDAKGVGIIHTSEPVQAVFFNPQVIKNNQRIYNKYSPVHMRRQEVRGQEKHRANLEFRDVLKKAKTVEDVVNLLGEYGSYFIARIPPGPLRTSVLLADPELAVGLKQTIKPEEQAAILKERLANVQFISPKARDDAIVLQAVKQAKKKIPYDFFDLSTFHAKLPSEELERYVVGLSPKQAQYLDAPRKSSIEMIMAKKFPQLPGVIINAALKYGINIGGYRPSRLMSLYDEVAVLYNRAQGFITKMQTIEANLAKARGEEERAELADDLRFISSNVRSDVEASIRYAYWTLDAIEMKNVNFARDFSIYKPVDLVTFKKRADMVIAKLKPYENYQPKIS